MWTFTETEILIGFYGQESGAGIASLGVIKFNTKCDPNFVPEPIIIYPEPVAAPAAPAEPPQVIQ